MQQGKGPPWESSYQRFQENKENAVTIAMSPQSGKAILVKTVVGHVLTALTFGRTVDIGRLISEAGPDEALVPRSDVWDKLERSFFTCNIKILEDEKYLKTDVLKCILPALVAQGYKDCTPEEQAEMSRWFGFMDWYVGLTRAGFVPSFRDEILGQQLNQDGDGPPPAKKRKLPTFVGN